LNTKGTHPLMASIVAHILNPVLSFQVKRKIHKSPDVATVRKAFGATFPNPKGATFTAATIGGIAGEWAEATGAGTGTDKVMLYLHGGAYIACSPRTHRPITGGFAKRGIRVFAADYRLAPENPFPAAVDDGLAAYQGLLDSGIAPSRLSIAGDSAGGGLALAVLLAAKERGLPMPAKAVLFSPWTDLAGTGKTLRTNANRDPMIVGSAVGQGAVIYLNGASPTTPLASPLYGDLAGLPPMQIHVGEREVLLADSTRLVDRLRAAGGRADIRIWPVVAHVFPLFNLILREGREALDQSADFIKIG
jgi:acetyl esterase/lipase